LCWEHDLTPQECLITTSFSFAHGLPPSHKEQQEHMLIAWYVGKIVGLMTRKLMPRNPSVATKTISTGDPQIVVAGAAALMYGGVGSASSIWRRCSHTGASQTAAPNFFLFLQYFETTYQSHFIHTIFNNSYNHTNSIKLFMQSNK
jgi:hypothetical protein